MSSPEPPTPERIFDLLAGFQRTSVVVAALELDLFSGIAAGAVTVEELAARTGASARGIRALVDYLVTIGLVHKEDGRYRLAPDAALFLDRSSPRFLGDTARFLTSSMIQDGYRDATASVRRGGATAALDSMAPNHPVWSEYARAMAPLFVAPAASLAERILADPRPVRRVLDVAAGHGLFGISMAARRTEASVTALDAPGVLEVVREHATAAGVADRIELLPGDAFDLDLGDGWDVILVANFLHHFDPPTVVRLLGRFRDALAPQGRLAVVEFVPNEDRVTPPNVAQFAMTMVATTRSGDAYTYAELGAMLGAAGFGPTTRGSLAGSPQRWMLAERDAPTGTAPDADRGGLPYTGLKKV